MDNAHELFKEIGFTWDSYHIYDIELLNPNEGYLEWLPKEIFQEIKKYLKYERRYKNPSGDEFESIFNDNTDKYWIIRCENYIYFCRRKPCVRSAISSSLFYSKFRRLDDLCNSNGTFEIFIYESPKNDKKSYKLKIIDGNRGLISFYIDDIDIEFCILDEIPIISKAGKYLHDKLVKILDYKSLYFILPLNKSNTFPVKYMCAVYLLPPYPRLCGNF